MQLKDVPVTRQRYSLEATFNMLPSTLELIGFLYLLSYKIEMTPVAPPYILDVDLPKGDGKGQHIHLNWTTSGVSFYTWHKYNFATLEIYTCKKFNQQVVLNYFKEILKPLNVESVK